MTWPAARDALAAAVAAVEAVDSVVTAAPRTAAALRSGTVAVVPEAPPARSSRRTPGGRTETVYRLSLTVARNVGSDPAAAALAVDAAVEAIDAALEQHITLGGAATATEAPDWTEATVADWPPGSGVNIVSMTADIPVMFVRTYRREA